MNCQCSIVRYFVNGSTSTAENTGRGSYNCTKCGLRVMQTPVNPAASWYCPERFRSKTADEVETEILIARGFARDRSVSQKLTNWARA